MKFITAQPDSDYFVWQIRVQMNNFRKFNIEKDAIVLFSYDMANGINPNALKLLTETKATIVFFPDMRENTSKKYISTIRPHIIKMFIHNLGRDLLSGHDIMYHDSDILFSSLPNFKTLSKKNKIGVSDTISYVGANYIKSKGDGLLEEMCKVVNIDPKLVEKNEKKSGGAQYFIPKNVNMNAEFWDKVEHDSASLYELMLNTSDKYTPTHPIQAWTADMWALLWNFWAIGHDTIITKELDFSWPTYQIEEWSKYNIFHNAGVTPDRTDLFFKGNFIKNSPFDHKHDNVSDKFCSIKYVEEIRETANLINQN